MSTIAPSPPVTGALAPPRYATSRKRSKLVSVALRASVPVAILVLWVVASASGAVSPQILPSPASVIAAAGEIIQSGQLGTYLLASLGRIGLGVGLGVSVGLVLGLLSGIATLGEQLTDVTMQIIRAVPFLALVPLFIAWFGIDDQFKVFFIAFAVVVPMYTYTFLAVRSADPKIHEAARSYGVRGAKLVTQVVLPQALPGVFMALRVCLSISITALIAVETIGTRAGIGYLVVQAQEYNRVDYMFVCLVLYALLGIAFDLIIRLTEHLFLPWRQRVAK